MIFLCGIAVAVLVMAERPYSPGILTLLGITLGFGLVGFLDDFLKVIRRKNLGLRAKQKLAAEFLLALALAGVSAAFLGRGTTIGFLSLGRYWIWVYSIILWLLWWCECNQRRQPDRRPGRFGGRMYGFRSHWLYPYFCFGGKQWASGRGCSSARRSAGFCGSSSRGLYWFLAF